MGWSDAPVIGSTSTTERRQGLTLIEVVVVAMLLGVTMGVVLNAFFQTQLAFAERMQRMVLDEIGRNLLTRIGDELRPADPSSINPVALDSSQTVWIRKLEGFEDGDPKLSEWIRLEFDPTETANGKDDNGDGLIDEGILKIRYGEDAWIPLSGRLLDARFTATANGISFTIVVGVPTRDGEVRQETYASEIGFRNVATGQAGAPPSS